MSASDSSLTIHLYSFGYKYGGVPEDPSGNGGGFVFDCRALPNPFWDERLRPFSGCEPPIVAYMEAQPEVQAYAAHAAELVLHAARTYTELGRTRLMVSFGCTGGRHRSVYLAEWMARHLGEAGFRVALEHTHLQRDAGKEEREGDDPGGRPGHPPAAADR